MLQPSQPLVYVEDNLHLATLCQAWAQLPLLALDTEFIRTNTFFPRPALIQLNDGTANYLIDPLKITEFEPLKVVLVDGSSRKVLHACSEDLEVFHRLFGELPNNMLDTQIAAAFVGCGFSVGYSALVEQSLGVAVPKDETRSDWLQRPLTDAQRHYAAMDVEFLYVIAQKLIAQLQDCNRLPWAEQECRTLIDSYYEAQRLDNAAQRLRGAWRLTQRQLALLKILASWRDEQARERDRPRNHIIKDKALYQIAELMPTHVAQLRKVSELSDKAIRRYGEALIEWVDVANGLREDQLPQRLPRNPNPQQQAQIKELRSKVAEVAEQMNIAPELIARKKDYEHIVRAAAQGGSSKTLLPQDMPAWRVRCLQPIIDEFVWNT